MIYATVGTQLPFDRLVAALDRWAVLRARGDVFIQVGRSEYKPRHAEYASFLDPDECQRRLESASIIVSHAGMGTIISALELGKPIIVMPRRSELGEHRNDHQLATVKHLSKLSLVKVAMDESELPEQLDRCDNAIATSRIGSSASEQLIGSIQDFLRTASDSQRGWGAWWRTLLGRSSSIEPSLS